MMEAEANFTVQWCIATACALYLCQSLFLTMRSGHVSNTVGSAVRGGCRWQNLLSGSRQCPIGGSRRPTDECKQYDAAQEYAASL
jgi:hypothetical protein